MSDFSYLTKAAEESEEIPVAQLGAMVVRFREAEKEVAQLEEDLKNAKERFNQVSQIDIPQLLLQNGLSEIRLSTGEKLRVSQEISASVKDIDLFRDFVNERGDEDILKTTLTLGKTPHEIVDKVRRMLMEQFELMSEITTTVHPMTLKKYIKEICGIGTEDAEERLGDRYVPMQELPEFIRVFSYFKTSIKNK